MALIVGAPVTMTGSDIAFTIPTDTLWIAFYADGGDISLLTTTAGNRYPILSGTEKTLQSRALMGQTIYFNGPAGTLRWLYETGVGS